MAVTGTQLGLFQEIKSYLTDMGLSGLFNVAADGTPSGWLWEQITSGLDNQSAIMLNLENTQQFQQRYGVIKQLRLQAQTDPSVHVPTVAQVRDYEQTVSGMMRQANVPSFMYDNFTDLQALMLKGLSPVEIEQRLGQTWERVQNTDPAVRQAYGRFFGIQGDAALAATYLDPARTLASLERMSRTAYTAGMGMHMGVNIDQATADRIAGSPSTDAGIYQDLQTLGGLAGSGIFQETLGEGGTNLTAEQTGVDATFFGNGQAQAAIDRRTRERKAQDAAVPGGALRTNRGLTGAGVASS